MVRRPNLQGPTLQVMILPITCRAEMTYPHIREDLKPKIKSIVVKEFQGIDHLPDSLEELKS